MTVQTAFRLSLGPPTAFRPPPGSKARAGALAGGAVLCWAMWPSLASAAQPAPPFLVFGLAAAVGFAVAPMLAVSRGEARAFVTTPPHTLGLVTVGLMVNNILFLTTMPRIGPAEANVIACLWPTLLVLILAGTRRQALGKLALGGMVLSFAGIVFAIGPTFATGFDPVGALLAFGSDLAFALYAAIRSQGTEAHDVIRPSMGPIAVLSLGAHVILEPPASLSLGQTLAIAGIGVAPLTLSNALWDRARGQGEPHGAHGDGLGHRLRQRRSWRSGCWPSFEPRPSRSARRWEPCWSSSGRSLRPASFAQAGRSVRDRP